MTMRSPQIQARIDAEYQKLEAFDPDIRNGLVFRPHHTPEERADIERRTKLYEAECLKFREFCERVVADILENPQSGDPKILRGDPYKQELKAA